MAGVEGADGREAPLWEAEEEERVGEAFREPGFERRPRERNAARPWDAPSGRMNFSLSSRLVRPRAIRDEMELLESERRILSPGCCTLHGSFLTRNSSSAIQPPPTLTITVLRRILTRRSC